MPRGAKNLLLVSLRDLRLLRASCRGKLHFCAGHRDAHGCDSEHHNDDCRIADRVIAVAG
jgi:hypothetical protein